MFSESFADQRRPVAVCLPDIFQPILVPDSLYLFVEVEIKFAIHY